MKNSNHLPELRAEKARQRQLKQEAADWIAREKARKTGQV